MQLLPCCRGLHLRDLVQAAALRGSGLDVYRKEACLGWRKVLKQVACKGHSLSDSLMGSS